MPDSLGFHYNRLSTIYRHFAAKHVNSHQAKSIFTGFLWTQLFPFIKFLYNPSWGTKLLVWIFLPWVWRPCVNGCQCRVITKEKVYRVAGWGGILMVSRQPFCVSEDEVDRIWGKPMIYEWRFSEANVWFSPYTLYRIKQWSISDINDRLFWGFTSFLWSLPETLNTCIMILCLI